VRRIGIVCRMLHRLTIIIPNQRSERIRINGESPTARGTRRGEPPKPDAFERERSRQVGFALFSACLGSARNTIQSADDSVRPDAEGPYVEKDLALRRAAHRFWNQIWSVLGRTSGPNCLARASLVGPSGFLW
jgi:hypothetical protein